MIALPPLKVLLASAGVTLAVASAVYALRAERPLAVANPEVERPACSSCDARHARLQLVKTDALKVQE